MTKVEISGAGKGLTTVSGFRFRVARSLRKWKYIEYILSIVTRDQLRGESFNILTTFTWAQGCCELPICGVNTPHTHPAVIYSDLQHRRGKPGTGRQDETFDPSFRVTSSQRGSSRHLQSLQGGRSVILLRSGPDTSGLPGSVKFGSTRERRITVLRVYLLQSDSTKSYLI
jgi:hypothetical protein